MKTKLLIAVVVSMMVAAGCSDDKQNFERLVLSQTEFEMYAGDEILFTANLPMKVNLSDEYVANLKEESSSDKPQYRLVGKFVGESYLTAATDNEQLKYRVVVKPRYTTYYEPAYHLFGKTMKNFDEIIAYEKQYRKLAWQPNETIEYPIDAVSFYSMNPKDGALFYNSHYYFHHGILRQMQVILPAEIRSEATKFIEERYEVNLDPRFPNTYIGRKSDVNIEIVSTGMPEAIVVKYDLVDPIQ